jgi:hypothetical protein
MKYGNISVLPGQAGHIPAEVGIFITTQACVFYFLSPALALEI